MNARRTLRPLALAFGILALGILAWIWWGGPAPDAGAEIDALEARAATAPAALAPATTSAISATTSVAGDDALASAVFAAGCFWCVEADFEKVPGVVEAVSGYTGGLVADPSYAQVAAGGTGHREAVRVFYDPAVTDYPALLDAFWRMHDPSDAGGSFVDRGYHYGSAIYPATAAERRYAEAARAALDASGKFDAPIATEIAPLGEFWVAEDYHQDFYQRSATRYRVYRFGSGRDQFIARAWDGDETRYGPASLDAVTADAER